MNTFSLGKRILLGLAGGVSVVGMTAAALIASPAAPAFADQVKPTPESPARGLDRITRLEQVYAREQNWLMKQGAQLTKANQVVTKVQDRINALQAKGKNVSALQTALDAFKASLATAQSDHDNAAAILATHAGFDSNGKVIDRTLALQTVRSAGKDLRACHRTLAEALKDLHGAILKWREANGSRTADLQVEGSASS